MLFTPPTANTSATLIPPNVGTALGSITASPNNITLAPGQSTIVDLTLASDSPNTWNAAINLINLPSDLTAVTTFTTEFTAATLTLTTNSYAIPAVYQLAIQAALYIETNNPRNPVITVSATTYVQVTISSPINLKNAKSLTNGVRQPQGAIRQMGQSGPFMRRLAIPVQSGKTPQVNWRHIFGSIKSNYTVVKTQAAVIGINQDLSPADAWALVNSDYFGIPLPGPTVDGVTGMGFFTHCATPDAYYAMAQATRISLMLPPLPTPVITTLYLSMPTGPVELTLGPYTVNIGGLTMPLLDFPDIYIDIGVNSTTTDTPIDSITASGTGVSISANGFTATSWPAHNITYSAIAGNYGDRYAQCILPGDALTGSGNYTNATTQGFEPSFMNQNPAGIMGFQPAPPGPYEGDAQLTWNTSNLYSSGTATTLGTVTFSNPIYNTASQRIHVWQTDDSLPSTIPITITIVAGGIEYTTTINLATTSGNLNPANKPPYFPIWNGLSCTTAVDSEMNVIGLFLQPTWYDQGQEGAPITGAFNPGTYPTAKNSSIAGGGFAYQDTAGMWLITASPAYTSSYSPPDASTWAPILATGPLMVEGDVILAAWKTVFGTLPASGNIKFQLSYADPDTGAVSPAISCTAGWQNGTLRGADVSSWTGPKFTMPTYGGEILINAPGTGAYGFEVIGVNGTTDLAPDPSKPYSGTITFTAISTTWFQTDTLKLKEMFPPGLTFTFDPPSVTIADGDNSIHAVVMTATATAGVWPYNGSMKISGTDEVSTASSKFTIALNGGSGTEPGGVLDNIGTTLPNPNPAPGTSVTQEFWLTNPTAKPLSATITAVSSSDNVTLTIASSGQTPILSAPITAAAATTVSATYSLDAFTDADYTQYVLNVSGCVPDGWNGGPWPITANDSTTVTVPNTADPGALTTPGTANISALTSGTTVTVPVPPPPVSNPAPTNFTGCSLLSSDSGYYIGLPLTIFGNPAGLYATVTDSTNPALDGGPWEITNDNYFDLIVNGPLTEFSAEGTGTVTITNPNSVVQDPTPYYLTYTTSYATFNLTVTAGTADTTVGVCIQISMTVGSVTQTYVFYLG